MTSVLCPLSPSRVPGFELGISLPGIGDGTKDVVDSIRAKIKLTRVFTDCVLYYLGTIEQAVSQVKLRYR